MGSLCPLSLGSEERRRGDKNSIWRRLLRLDCVFRFPHVPSGALESPPSAVEVGRQRRGEEGEAASIQPYPSIFLSLEASTNGARREDDSRSQQLFWLFTSKMLNLLLPILPYFSIFILKAYPQTIFFKIFDINLIYFFNIYIYIYWCMKMLGKRRNHLFHVLFCKGSIAIQFGPIEVQRSLPVLRARQFSSLMTYKPTTESETEFGFDWRFGIMSSSANPD